MIKTKFVIIIYCIVLCSCSNSSIKEINLTGQNKKEIPSDVLKQQHCTALTLRDNNIESLPLQLSQLKKLKRIDLSWNKLTHVPPVLFQMHQLEEINLAYNQIKLLPDSLFLLPNLKKLVVFGNLLDDDEIVNTEMRFKGEDLSCFVILVDPGTFFLNKGMSLHKENKLKHVEYYYNKSIKENPGLSEAYFYRGLFYHNRKDHDKAFRDYGFCLQLKSDHQFAYLNRGTIRYFFRNDKAGACQDWQKSNTDQGRKYIQQFCK